MKRLFCLLLCLCVLSATAFAGQDETLERQIDNFIYSHGLSEENFALSYYNVDTGERYDYNPTSFFAVGDVWTLPLHMYYLSEEHDGAFLPDYNDPNYNNPDYEYTINGMNLDTCRTETILRGNDELAEAMRDEVQNYKFALNEALGHIGEGELPDSYFYGNSYSTQFLMNCLVELERQDDIYSELMRLYAQAQPPEPVGVLSADLPNTLGFITVQIRSDEDDMVCSVAEVVAPDTYLIACFVSEEAGGDRTMAELNDLILSYVKANSENSQDVAATTVGFSRSEDTFKVTTQNPHDPSSLIMWIGIALGCGVVLAGLWYLGYRLYKNYKYRRRYRRRKN